MFESLPKDQRKELKELPSVLERLQHDAALMRHTVDELNNALAQLGEGPAGADAERESLRADLVHQREAASQQMAKAVTALETLRLNLLRLKAGIGSIATCYLAFGRAAPACKRCRNRGAARGGFRARAGDPALP